MNRKSCGERVVGWGWADWVGGWGSVECCGRIEVWRVGGRMGKCVLGGWIG